VPSPQSIKKNKINHIFISHLHGDHYFGLIGLITSYALNNRQQDLHIYSPSGLQRIIEIQLDTVQAKLPYQCFFHELKAEGIILEEKSATVECFRVNHRIECYGFIFREKKNPRKINVAAVNKYSIPYEFYDNLHLGEDYTTPENIIIKNDLLTTPTPAPKSYAFCADTTYYEPIIEKIKDVDLIYHEATYLNDLEEKAVSRNHSTSKHAATIAKKCGTKKLLIGHFSSMYETGEQHREEAIEIFENTEIAKEGVCYFV
jgi:ribonuclease Z